MYQHFKQGLLAAAIAMLLAPVAWAQASDVDIHIDKVLSPYARAWAERLGDYRGLKPSSHWMGVVVRPTDPVLRKHLQIEGGLVVEHVTKDSPAATGGIEKDDILLSVGDTAISDLATLMKFLSENKDSEVTVKLLRTGKETSVKVTPEKRPAAHERFFPPEGFGRWELQEKELDELRKWFERWGPQFDDGEEFKKWIDELMKQREEFGWKFKGPEKMRFFHPGVVLSKDARVNVHLGDLPEGLRVIVIKQGDDPAKIQVQRGDEEWEVTENELDKLPEDVRAHVKKYLGQSRPLGIRVEVPKKGEAPRVRLRGVPGAPGPRVEARAIRIGADSRIDKRLDEINERLERIEKALQKLTGEKQQ